MASQYSSKHGTVSKPPYELYLSFADMRNFLQMLPEDKKQGVKADFDTIEATIQGFHVGVKVKSRVPYSLIEVEDHDAPFHFNVALHFDPTDLPGKTDFHIDVAAELNLMLKMLLGSKIQGALDKIVDSLVDLSEGRMPEGFDPSQFPAGFNR